MWHYDDSCKLGLITETNKKIVMSGTQPAGEVLFPILMWEMVVIHQFSVTAASDDPQGCMSVPRNTRQ